MDFEEFRRKKKAQEEEAKQAKEREVRPMANGKPNDFVDGFGPQGPKNPKVKGFVLGRYAKKRIDPKTLEKPEGYESTSRAPAAETTKTQAEIELERKKRQLEKMQADLEAAQEKQREAEIEARRKAEGFGSIKGRQRY